MENENAIEEGGVPATSDNTKDQKKKLKKIWSHTPMEIVSGAFAGLSVGTSVTAMILAPSTPVFIAGALSSVIGPYAYYQQTKLTDILALKETHEAVKREVDIFVFEGLPPRQTFAFEYVGRQLVCLGAHPQGSHKPSAGG